MRKRAVLVAFVVLVFCVSIASAQSTDFSYQGQLQNSTALANGTFDFEFALFGSALGGSQIGSTLSRTGVSVANGIFSVSLDFGNQFDGSGRFLEIRVRQSGGGAFTTLSPRQSLVSSPYAVRSLESQNSVNAQTAVNATAALTATNATNAVNLTGPLTGDVIGTQGSTTVARLRGTTVASTAPTNGQVLKFSTGTNQWQPATDETGSGGGGGTITDVVAGTGLTGGGTTGTVTVGIANGGVGTTQLADANVTDAKIVSISGAKVTGAVANSNQLGGVAASSYLQTNGNGSALNDLNASSITTGTLANARLGQIPTTNIADGAVTAAKISVGQVVKSLNSLTDNVTLAAGTNVTITPSGNTLTIASTGGGNAILNQTTQQTGANFNISGTGTANIFNSASHYNIGGNRALGADASNVFVGINTGLQTTTGDDNVFVGNTAGFSNTAGRQNAFVGRLAGSANTGGIRNSFFGFAAGTNNAGGSTNTFVGASAGSQNTTGSSNTFVGINAGVTNITGSSNTLIGTSARVSSGDLTNASAIGSSAVVSQSDSLVLGSIAGQNFAANSAKVGVGTTVPRGPFEVVGDWNGQFGALTVTGDRPTIRFSSDDAVSNNQQWILHLGSAAGVVPAGSLSFFNGGSAGTSYGLPVFAVTPNNSVVVTNLGFAGAVALCRNTSNEIASCSSSLRYKNNISSFHSGLSFVKKLRPISFDWKDGAMKDIGFGAEEIAAIDPRFVTHNARGEVEGVKYDRLSVVFVNALKEQQMQIQSQQREIDKLISIVCTIKPEAEVCEPKNR